MRAKPAEGHEMRARTQVMGFRSVEFMQEIDVMSVTNYVWSRYETKFEVVKERG